jgi:hypothetical protein
MDVEFDDELTIPDVEKADRSRADCATGIPSFLECSSGPSRVAGDLERPLRVDAKRS